VWGLEESDAGALFRMIRTHVPRKETMGGMYWGGARYFGSGDVVEMQSKMELRVDSRFGRTEFGELYFSNLFWRNGTDVYALIESPEKCLSNAGVFMSNGAGMKEKTYIHCLRYNVTSRSHRPPVTKKSRYFLGS
jgi:hypothetical protein